MRKKETKLHFERRKWKFYASGNVVKWRFGKIMRKNLQAIGGDAIGKA